MRLHEANLTNLVTLWKKYGSQQISSASILELHTNTHWPHRCWFDWNTSLDEETLQPVGDYDINTLLKDVSESAIVPVWPKTNETSGDRWGSFFEQQLKDNHWRCAFNQAAMCLDLKDAPAYSEKKLAGFEVKRIHALEDVTEWIDIGNDAFAYVIDRPVIERLVNQKDIQLLLGCLDGNAVASGLLFKTGDIIGIHQVGVRSALQGKGIAKAFMKELLVACQRWSGRYVVLQASEVGRPLYDSLGFKFQFLIKNYQRTSLKHI